MILASAGTIEQLTKIINKYYFSNNYYIENINNNYIIKNKIKKDLKIKTIVKKEKNRYYFILNNKEV